jgi:hypothetical protein
MNDRRKATPPQIQVKHEKPPAHTGRVHTVNAKGMLDIELEPWLEKMGYHTGYIYMDGDIRLLSYFESDRLAE